MRFLIILAAALAVARAGSYGGGHGYGGGGRLHGGFNAHQFDVPVGANFGGIGGGIRGGIGGGGFGGSIGYRGGAVGGGASLGMIGGGFNAHQFDVPVGTASIGYDTGFGGGSLGAGSLTAGGAAGIYDTSIGGDVYVDDGYAGGFDGGYVGGGLTNARIVDTDLGFVDYDGQFDDVQYGGIDYGYDYGGASLGPGAAVTVLTNSKCLFCPHTNQVSLESVVLVPLTTMLERHVVCINQIISKSSSFGNNSLYHFRVYFDLDTL